MREIHIKDGKLTVDLGGEFARLFVNESLQAEFGLGDSGPMDFEAKLTEARASVAACQMLARMVEEMQEQERKPDHVLKPAQRPAAFAAGFESGLRWEFKVIGVDKMHGITGSAVPPDHKFSGPSHRRGWELGTAIYAALQIAEGNPDPRAHWKKRLIKKGAKRAQTSNR